MVRLSGGVQISNPSRSFSCQEAVVASWSWRHRRSTDLTTHPYPSRPVDSFRQARTAEVEHGSRRLPVDHGEGDEGCGAWLLREPEPEAPLQRYQSDNPCDMIHVDPEQKASPQEWQLARCVRVGHCISGHRSFVVPLGVATRRSASSSRSRSTLPLACLSHREFSQGCRGASGRAVRP